MATVTAPDTSVPGIAEVLSPVDLPPVFFSFTPDEAWAVPRDSWWLSVSNWAIHQERIQGARIQSLGDWTDRMLSASATSEPGNRSYLRLGFATESDYSDLARFEPEARFRLDLPTTRRKLRLLIESESEELIPLEERQRDRQLTDTERTDTQTTGALRYLSSIGDAIHLSNDIGGRLRFPPDAFWRATAGQTLHRAGGWTLGWQQRLYYYHQSGWGARTWAGASRHCRQAGSSGHRQSWNGSTKRESSWLRRFSLSAEIWTAGPHSFPESGFWVKAARTGVPVPTLPMCPGVIACIVTGCMRNWCLPLPFPGTRTFPTRALSCCDLKCSLPVPWRDDNRHALTFA